MEHTSTRRPPSAPVPIPENAPRFYSVAQAARMFGMSTMTLYRAINAGGFPAVRIRGRLTVPAKAIDAIVDTAIAEQTVVDTARWVPEQHRGVE